MQTKTASDAKAMLTGILITSVITTIAMSFSAFDYKIFGLPQHDSFAMNVTLVLSVVFLIWCVLLWKELNKALGVSGGLLYVVIFYASAHLNVSYETFMLSYVFVVATCLGVVYWLTKPKKN